MANPRVHPSTVDSSSQPPSFDSSSKQSQPVTGEAYVVQIPRDQILRRPPPENVRRFEALSHRGSGGGGCCRRCCCCFLCLIISFIIALGIAAGVLYLVFRFKSPNYSVTDVAISGINLNGNSTAPISPVFNVTVRADNPNGKVGIYYLDDGTANVFFEDVLLSSGALPVFYQPPRNVTLIQTNLTGTDVVLGSGLQSLLASAQRVGIVAFEVRVRAPVKIRVGSANTWRIVVKVDCTVAVDSLSSGARVLANDCGYRVKWWFW